MEITELRIGNIINCQTIHFNNGEVFELTAMGIGVNYLSPGGIDDAIAFNAGLQGGYPLVSTDDCEPIPLTKEWLIKLGMEDMSYSGLLRYGIGDFELGEYKKEWFLVDRERQLSLKVKYVHQLQNLYFALTDEELVIKQPIPQT